MNWTVLLVFTQLVFAGVIGLYFWNLLRSQQSNKTSMVKETKKELEKLNKMRKISLTEPLAEQIRPKRISEVIGQEDGIDLLRAAICGPNPQHVIIYGPPGIGKTAAARLVLKEAIKSEISPFAEGSPFVELDATAARFDERGIADPLIGSVHDPIYQGAGAMGQAGIPQPKQGAVSRAHGGLLFIDEIGELHPVQMNKLLKVLEDRKVFPESTYYSSENSNIPRHIHDIFQNGWPADFRLIGATTRSPDELPPAIRSRCVEIHFNNLAKHHIKLLITGAADRLKLAIGDRTVEKILQYVTNGRDTIHLIQIAAGFATLRQSPEISLADVEKIIAASRMAPTPDFRIMANEEGIGHVHGLAVYGHGQGMLLAIEVSAARAAKGTLTVTGIVEEESLGSEQKSLRRKSLIKSSIENVLTCFNRLGLKTYQYHIHVNFPGGHPIDGPSAGIALASAVYSAITKTAPEPGVALTGELSIHGLVKPVGGVAAKIKAAKDAGANTVVIPRENYETRFSEIDGVQVLAVSSLNEVLTHVFKQPIPARRRLPQSTFNEEPPQSV